jgi:hypothetical protein
MPEEPTQPTQPVEGDPVEIPVPTREDVLRDLQKVAKPSRDRRNGGANKKS